MIQLASTAGDSFASTPHVDLHGAPGLFQRRRLLREWPPRYISTYRQFTCNATQKSTEREEHSDLVKPTKAQIITLVRGWKSPSASSLNARIAQTAAMVVSNYAGFLAGGTKYNCLQSNVSSISRKTTGRSVFGSRTISTGCGRSPIDAPHGTDLVSRTTTSS